MNVHGATFRSASRSDRRVPLAGIGPRSRQQRDIEARATTSGRTPHSRARRGGTVEVAERTPRVGGPAEVFALELKPANTTGGLPVAGVSTTTAAASRLCSVSEPADVGPPGRR
jgi:hypothetical protein